MSPLDEQLIHRKAKLIEEDLQKLVPYQKLAEENYCKDEMAQLAVERLMERNILAHEYDIIDPVKVYQAITDALKEVPHYLQTILSQIP